MYRREKIRLFYVVWSIALAVVVVIIVTQRHETTTFYGLAETRETMINAESPVAIKRLLVMAGQEVRKGDLLVEFERPELTLKINEIRHERDELETKRYIRLEEIKAQINRIRAQKARKTSEIRGRIQQLEVRCQINKKICSDLTTVPDEIGDRDKNRSPLKIRIASLEEELALESGKLQVKMDFLLGVMNAPESPDGICMQRLQRELDLLLKERNKLYIFSPVSGVVGTVNVKVGEKVSPFEPVLTVHTRSPSYVKGFIHESAYNRIAVGDDVVVGSPARIDKEVRGTVVGVGSRIVELPERLRRRPDVQVWGREVFIKVPDNNILLLGEKIRISSPVRHKTGSVWVCNSKKIVFVSQQGG